MIRDSFFGQTARRTYFKQQHSQHYDMNDDMRMQEDDAQADNRNNRSSRRGGMEMPDDEPALDGYAR